MRTNSQSMTFADCTRTRYMHIATGKAESVNNGHVLKMQNTSKTMLD